LFYIGCVFVKQGKGFLCQPCFANKNITAISTVSTVAITAPVQTSVVNVSKQPKNFIYRLTKIINFEFLK